MTTKNLEVNPHAIIKNIISLLYLPVASVLEVAWSWIPRPNTKWALINSWLIEANTFPSSCLYLAGNTKITEVLSFLTMSNLASLLKLGTTCVLLLDCLVSGSPVADLDTSGTSEKCDLLSRFSSQESSVDFGSPAVPSFEGQCLHSVGDPSDPRNSIRSNWVATVLRSEDGQHHVIRVPSGQSYPQKATLEKQKSTLSKKGRKLEEPRKLARSDRRLDQSAQVEYPRTINADRRDSFVGSEQLEPGELEKSNEGIRIALPGIWDSVMWQEEPMLSELLLRSGVREFLPRSIEIFLYHLGIDFKNQKLHGKTADFPNFRSWYRSLGEHARATSTSMGGDPFEKSAIRQLIRQDLYNRIRATFQELERSNLSSPKEFTIAENKLLKNLSAEYRRFLQAIQSEYSSASSTQLKKLREACLEINAELNKLVDDIGDGSLVPGHVDVSPSHFDRSAHIDPGHGHIDPASSAKLDCLLRRLLFVAKGCPQQFLRMKTLPNVSRLSHLRITSPKVRKLIHLIDSAKDVSLAEDGLLAATSRVADFRDQILKEFFETNSQHAPAGNAPAWLTQSDQELKKLVTDLESLRLDEILKYMNPSEKQSNWLASPQKTPTSKLTGWQSDAESVVSDRTAPEEVSWNPYGYDTAKFHQLLTARLEGVVGDRLQDAGTSP
ncbi:hypothetical protein MJO28_003185 [Puccinia striiformis f. sp. tritici]|uniref:Uncharacterized protein n=1 Tax=Puccinia striiformis f. sp. tritici TaxID=168172 RepID=A0ACC0EST4_9BASI|nr:hypothetical protein MJO28_003185 [Puccinia striiformis f. sp. tritici]